MIASVFQVSLALMVCVLSAKPSKPAAMAEVMSCEASVEVIEPTYTLVRPMEIFFFFSFERFGGIPCNAQTRLC